MSIAETSFGEVFQEYLRMSQPHPTKLHTPANVALSVVKPKSRLNGSATCLWQKNSRVMLLTFFRQQVLDR